MGDQIEVGETGATQTIASDQAQNRLDSWLAETYSQWSRAQWQQGIQDEIVLLNDLPTRNSARLAVGDEVTIVSWPNTGASASLAETELPPIIYQDADVWVFDKPSGLLVHPASGRQEPSIAGAVQHLTSDSDTQRPGIVHRLDRDTSGALIVAKHDAAKKQLQTAWRAHAVKKIYLAMVIGEVPAGGQRLAFNLGREVSKPQKVVVDPMGRPSETIIHGLSRGQGVSLVQAEPVTGRTHQIRVHLAAIKHPVAGDAIYGGKLDQISRLMLHAWKLTVPFPNGSVKTFVSPIPEDFKRICEEYRCPLPTE